MSYRTRILATNNLLIYQEAFIKYNIHAALYSRKARCAEENGD